MQCSLFVAEIGKKTHDWSILVRDTTEITNSVLSLNAVFIIDENLNKIRNYNTLSAISMLYFKVHRFRQATIFTWAMLKSFKHLLQ